MTLPITVSVETARPRPPLWMIKEDRELFGSIRPCAPCPAVIVLSDDPHALFTEQWQYYLAAINAAMELEDVYLLLDWRLAFANGSGFRKPESPKADYFHRRDLDQKPPSLDKVRSCVRNVLTGTPAFSLVRTIQDVIALAGTVIRREPTFLATRASFASLMTTAPNVLSVWTFDSAKLPPLKPGRSYPGRIEDVDPDDYLYLPRTNPEKFATANIVNKSGDVVQFPRGGLYPWTGDNTLRSFMPHLSNHAYGKVLYSLSNLAPVTTAPNPYRSA
jgi:hypothetical protein